MEKKKKKRKKKSEPTTKDKVVGTILLLVIIIFAFRACFGGSDKKDKTPVAETSTVAASEKAAPTMSKEDFADFTRKTLAEEGLSCTVDIEDNFLVIKAYNEDLATDLALLALGDEEAINGWYSLRDSLVTATTSMRNAAVSNGLDDLHITFMLMNPLNKEASILTIADDFVFSDSMEEIIKENESN